MTSDKIERLNQFLKLRNHSDKKYEFYGDKISDNSVTWFGDICIKVLKHQLGLSLGNTGKAFAFKYFISDLDRYCPAISVFSEVGYSYDEFETKMLPEVVIDIIDTNDKYIDCQRKALALSLNKGVIKEYILFDLMKATVTTMDLVTKQRTEVSMYSTDILYSKYKKNVVFNTQNLREVLAMEYKRYTTGLAK